jgi:hypothetical protein
MMRAAACAPLSDEEGEEAGKGSTDSKGQRTVCISTASPSSFVSSASCALSSMSPAVSFLSDRQQPAGFSGELPLPSVHQWSFARTRHSKEQERGHGGHTAAHAGGEREGGEHTSQTRTSKVEISRLLQQDLERNCSTLDREGAALVS